MADYDRTGPDLSAVRVLLAGGTQPSPESGQEVGQAVGQASGWASGQTLLAALMRFRVEEAAGPLPEALRAARPDILVITAENVTAGLADCLAGPMFDRLPVVLLVGPEDADAAGLLLERPLTILDLPVDGLALRDAVTAAAAGLAAGAADSGARFEMEGRIAALKREAERVATALADIASGVNPDAARPIDSGRIRSHIRSRRQRERFFPADLFADPAWDMFLDLTAARMEARRVSVSSLCIAAAVPTTTALRWVKQLVDRGMLERSSDPQDARRSFIDLSPGTAAAMEGALQAVLNPG